MDDPIAKWPDRSLCLRVSVVGLARLSRGPCLEFQLRWASHATADERSFKLTTNPAGTQDLLDRVGIGDRLSSQIDERIAQKHSRFLCRATRFYVYHQQRFARG